MPPCENFKNGDFKKISGILIFDRGILSKEAPVVRQEALIDRQMGQPSRRLLLPIQPHTNGNQSIILPGFFRTVTACWRPAIRRPFYRSEGFVRCDSAHYVVSSGTAFKWQDFTALRTDDDVAPPQTICAGWGVSPTILPCVLNEKASVTEIAIGAGGEKVIDHLEPEPCVFL